MSDSDKKSSQEKSGALAGASASLSSDSRGSFRMPMWLSAILPILLLGILIYLIVHGTLGEFRVSFPPVEELSIQRIVLPELGKIVVHVVNDGPSPVTIAQVTVDEAIWRDMTIEPRSTLGHLEKATITIAYPWVEGEAHAVTLITSTGLTFSKEIPVAVQSPRPSLKLFVTFAMLGIYVGVIPVCLGLLWFPFLKRLSRGWFDFLISLTVGLLVFLGVDAFAESIELSERVPGSYQGVAIITIGLLLTILLLTAVSRHAKAASAQRGESYGALVLAYLVAFGIGVHNLGEGLAIGAAYAVGEIAMGTLLVLGFTIHNTTEGIAIVAPVARSKFKSINLLWMGLLAGGPTIIGTYVGGFTYSDVWSVLFLAVGAGAVFQVAYQIIKGMAARSIQTLVSFSNVAGFLAGLLIMYVTGLFVAV